jgi:cell division protein FtsQ
MLSDTALLNRISARIALVSLLAILWSLFAWANSKNAFALRQIAVQAPIVEVDPGLLESAIRSDLRGTFFTVSPHRVRVNLKKLPWVRDVVVERRWPYALDVKIEEYKAVGYWGDNDLLSDKGEVFRAASRAPMPRFDGPVESASEALARYREAKLALAPLGLEIKSVAVSSRGSLSMTMRSGPASGLAIELGRENVEQRLARFIAIYSSWSPAQRESVARVDLRYKSALAVSRVGLASLNSQGSSL